MADAHAERVPGPAGLEDHPHLQTRLATLVLIRWLAIAGQLSTIVVVELSIGDLPLIPVLGTIAGSAALNLALTLHRRARARIDQRAAAWHLAFDLVQLAVLIGLTGGLANPFALFLLAPVTVAAATLSGRRTALLAGGAMALATVVGQWHLPLPWPDAPLDLPTLYRAGVWAALLLGTVSVAFFTWRMAAEARRIAAAYSATRVALAQEARMAEVGALAAAVAHELNTPLATVHLVAREISSEIGADSPLQPELRTLIGQTERCRDTLARLTRARSRGAAMEGERVAFPALVELAAEPHIDGAQAAVIFDHRGRPGQTMPWVERSPEILHGIGNFIQNALQFARSRVVVETWWDDDGMGVRISDDGPGISAHVLERLGEPYLSTRDGDGAHLGLGVFIATTLLERTGATVSFANTGEGAAVTVRWRGPTEERPA